MTTGAAVIRGPEHLRTPGHSVPVTRAEMEARIARVADLKPDLAAFPDLKDPSRQRSVSYVISPGGTAGPAAITAPHNFHMAMLVMSKGVKPSTHSHPYNEIFIPLEGRFRFYWGENLEESADLGPFDTISVPAGVFRTFENLDDGVGRILSLFDTAGDPHTGIVVPQAIFDQYYKGWVPGIEPKG
jgi:quercetin dioxygenase-like cupin family protein